MFGAPVESLFQLAFLGFESPVDGRGTDREQLLLAWAEIAKRLVAQGSHNGRSALRRAEHG